MAEIDKTKIPVNLKNIEDFKGDCDSTYVTGKKAQDMSDNQKVQAQNNIQGKEYDASAFSGLGKKILAKNVVQLRDSNAKNILDQTFFNDDNGNLVTNTVFVIQYDYELGEDIEIGAGCTLEFDGGSIKNAAGNIYKITGNNTKINIDATYNIFDDTLGGGFLLPYIDIRWFGGVSDYNERTKTGTNSATALERAINVAGQYYNGLYIYIVGQYYIASPITTIYDFNVKGIHSQTRNLLDSPDVSAITSLSLIAMAGNCPITMVGRGAVGSQTKHANFNIQNIKVVGTDIENSIFIRYTASGAPSRICIIEECEFTNLRRCLLVSATGDSAIGNLTISKCLAYENMNFIYAENTNNLRTLCNLVIKDCNIEHNDGKCILMYDVFGTIIIDNNILEGQREPIFITSREADISITNNYFEENSGFAINMEDSGGGTAIIENNYIEPGSTIKVRLYNYHIKRFQSNLFINESNIGLCKLYDSEREYNFACLPLWQCITFNSVAFGDVGYFAEDPYIYKDIKNNVLGRQTTDTSQSAEPNYRGYVYFPDMQQDEEYFVVFYSSDNKYTPFTMISGGSANSFSCTVRKGINVIKVKAVAAGDNELMMMDNGIFVSPFQKTKTPTFDAFRILDTSHRYIGDRKNLKNIADKPVGLSCFDTTLSKMVYWNGFAWTFADGTFAGGNNVTEDFVENKYINTSGNDTDLEYVSTTDMNCLKVNVVAGSTVLIKGAGGYGARLWALVSLTEESGRYAIIDKSAEDLDSTDAYTVLNITSACTLVVNAYTAHTYDVVIIN